MYLRLFGGARLESDGSPVRGRAAHRRRLGLLALLANAPVPSGRVSRERITGLLWPESSPDAARKLLSESLYVLRKELGEGALVAAGDELSLDGTVLPSDVAEFRGALSASDFERAAASYAGPFLDGWYIKDAPDFERWAERERDTFERSYCDCVKRLAEAAESEGRWPSAVEWWRTLAAVDRYSGSVALRLASAQAAAGERAAALRTLAAHEATLRDELEVPPDPAVVAFARQLRESTGSPPATSSSMSPSAVVVPTPMAAAPISVVPPARPSTFRRRRQSIIVALIAMVLVSTMVFAARSSFGGSGERSPLLPQFDPNDVAVRPFQDLSGHNEPLAAALTDELTRRLAGVAPLRVASRNAVLHARDSTIGLDSLARALRVGTVIEGTIRTSAGRISAVVLITDVATGKYVGAMEVKSDSGDYFGLVDELASQIERDFRRRLGESFRLRELTRGTRSGTATRFAAEAQRAIDLSRETAREWRADAIPVSRRYLLAADSLLQLATGADPEWAQPVIQRAYVASRLAASDPPERKARTLDSAIATLDELLSRQPSSAAAFELRGQLRFQRFLMYDTRDTTNRDLHVAIADFERAKSLDSLRVGAWTGRAFAAWFELDTVAARRNLESAVRLDAYLDGESDILMNQFYVALWLRDWNAAAEACRTGRRQDPWSYLFLQCELTLARHDVTRRADPVWAWAVVDTLGRMYPPDKAARAGRYYSPLYWRVVAATIAARAGRRQQARAAMDTVVARATRDHVLTDLAPDRAYFEWVLGDTAAATSIMAAFLKERGQQRANMEADALLGPIIARLAPPR